MESSTKLKETVERAQKEVKELLEETRAGIPNRSKLETGLKELQSDLKIIDIHVHKPDSR